MNKHTTLKHVRQLYENNQRELVNCTVQAYFYEREVDNPTHIGKEQAESTLKIYQDRIKQLESILEGFRIYTKEVLNYEL